MDDRQNYNLVGIGLAVFTFVLIYAYTDLHLLSTGKHELRNLLLWGVWIKASTQLFPIFELSTGLASVAIVIDFANVKTPFISSYLITMVDGFSLSLLVLMLMSTIRLMQYLYKS